MSRCRGRAIVGVRSLLASTLLQNTALQSRRFASSPVRIDGSFFLFACLRSRRTPGNGFSVSQSWCHSRLVRSRMALLPSQWFDRAVLHRLRPCVHATSGYCSGSGSRCRCRVSVCLCLCLSPSCLSRCLCLDQRSSHPRRTAKELLVSCCCASRSQRS